MKQIIFKHIHVTILFLLPILAFAENGKNEFNEIKKKYNSKEFDYVIENEKPKEESDLSILEPIINLLNKINWEIVMYCIISLVFLLIVFKLYKNGILFNFKNNQKLDNSDETNFDFIETNLLQIDLNELIEKAKSNKNYRLAIRYYHYQNTQNLAQKDLITWNPKKTNQQLINEIKKEEIKDLFKHNTQIFNQVWFGNFELNEEQFNLFETNFKFLNQTL